jgi:polar amino acid transport system substrate-binding protein
VIRKFLLASVFILLLAVNAQGVELRVVTEDWPPYTFSQRGEVKGLVTEIMRATLDRVGMDYTIGVYPWARAYEMAQAEENVLIYSIFKLPARADKFKWINIEGLSVNMSLFKPKHRDDIKLSSLDDARKYRVGVTRETSTHHFLLSRGFTEGINIFPVNCEEQNALKSQPHTGRIDLTTGDRLSLACSLKLWGIPSDYWVEQVPLFQQNLYMAFGLKTSDEVVEKVRKGFYQIKNEGKLDAIVEKYYNMVE